MFVGVGQAQISEHIARTEFNSFVLARTGVSTIGALVLPRMMFLVMLLCQLEAFVNQINVVLRRPASVRCFLLEAVHYVNHLSKTHRVNRPKSVNHMPFNQLQHARAVVYSSGVTEKRMNSFMNPVGAYLETMVIFEDAPKRCCNLSITALRKRA